MVTLGLSAASLPQTAGSHIFITECNVHTHRPGVKHAWVDPFGALHQVTDFPTGQAFLAIAYRNTAAKPAVSIDFGLVSRGELVAVAHDRGEFKPNQRVGHEFVILRLSVDRDLTSRRELSQCAVLSVTYADGTRWQNPSPPI